MGIGSPECHHHGVSPYGCCVCSTALPGGVTFVGAGSPDGLSVTRVAWQGAALCRHQIPGWHCREMSHMEVLGRHCQGLCPSGCWVPAVALSVPVWVLLPRGWLRWALGRWGVTARGVPLWALRPQRGTARGVPVWVLCPHHSESRAREYCLMGTGSLKGHCQGASVLCAGFPAWHCQGCPHIEEMGPSTALPGAVPMGCLGWHCQKVSPYG